MQSHLQPQVALGIHSKAQGTLRNLVYYQIKSTVLSSKKLVGNGQGNLGWKQGAVWKPEDISPVNTKLTRTAQRLSLEDGAEEAKLSSWSFSGHCRGPASTSHNTPLLSNFMSRSQGVNDFKKKGVINSVHNVQVNAGLKMSLCTSSHEPLWQSDGSRGHVSWGRLRSRQMGRKQNKYRKFFSVHTLLLFHMLYIYTHL